MADTGWPTEVAKRLKKGDGPAVPGHYPPRHRHDRPAGAHRAAVAAHAQPDARRPPPEGSGPRRDRSADPGVRPRPATRKDPVHQRGTALRPARVRGRLRLLGGMVRVNQPWLLITGLSRALAGVFATAAFGLIRSDIWQVTLYTGPLRDAVFTLLSIRTPVRLPGQSDA
ncbi:hypothetical protein FNV62_40285 [Streptomyces sp. RLB3-17]|nr:hypothetical protein FNV62_40285 [Streptomyces sp. RLB3-17]